MNERHDPDCESGGTYVITWPFGDGKHDSKGVEWPDHNQCVRENKMPICIMRQMGAHIRKVTE